MSGNFSGGVPKQPKQGAQEAAMRCPHMNFQASLQVARLQDTGRFQADVRIECTECKVPMRFLGLPMGLDLNGAAVSADGTEARLAIYPVRQVVPGFDEANQPAGFRVLNQMIPIQGASAWLGEVRRFFEDMRYSLEFPDRLTAEIAASRIKRIDSLIAQWPKETS